MQRDDSLADSYTGLTLKTLTDGYTPLVPNQTLSTPTSAAPDWIQRTELPFAFDSPEYQEPTIPTYKPQGEPYRASNVNEWQTMKQFGLGTLTGLDYATGAPARKFIAESAKGRDPFSAFIAGLSQYGKRPETAPTGKDIASDIGFSTMGFKEAAQKAGQDPDFYPDWSPAGIVGTGIEGMADISPMAAMMMPAKRVFHGTPHYFKKFSMDKIGTGEGAQAFGFGLYVTDSKEIAEEYARNIGKAKGKGVPQAHLYKGKIIELEKLNSGIYSPEEETAYMLKNAMERDGKSLDEAKTTAVSYLRDRSAQARTKKARRELNDEMELINSIKLDDFQPKGEMFYTTKIPEGEYLVWDKPIGKTEKERVLSYIESNPDDVAVDFLKSKDFNIGIDDLKTSLSQENGDSFYRLLSTGIGGSPKDASEFLNRAGFKGTQYPAGSLSGVKNSKAKNYVLFSDEGLDIDEIKNLSTGNVEKVSVPESFKNSRVVNDKGELLEVYHGGDYAKKDFSDLGPDRGSLGVAYFTDNKRTAGGYSLLGGAATEEQLADPWLMRRELKKEGIKRTPHTTKAYLDIKKPLKPDQLGYEELESVLGKDEIKKLVQEDTALMEMDEFVDEFTGKTKLEEWGYDDLDDYLDHGDNLKTYISNEYDYESLLEQGFTGDEDVLSLVDEASSAFTLLHTSGKLDDFMKKMKYDGIIYNDAESLGKTYVPIKASQIKVIK